jgi:hypothetical protein
MEPFSRDLRDPDIDGPDNSLSKSEGSKPHVTIWLLAGIALVSMAWGGSAIYRDLQRERVFVRTVSRPHSEEPKCRRPKRAELEPLFPKTPLEVRKLGFPTSQVDLAFVMRQVEARNEEALLLSHDGADIVPTIDVTKLASYAIRPWALPGLKIDGWLMRISDSNLCAQGEHSKFVRYSEKGTPPVYEVLLAFPDELAGYSVCLWSWNFDFESKEFTCPNSKLELIKRGDWVRVFGILWPESRVEWEPSKPEGFLSLGEMKISDIERIAATQP